MADNKVSYDELLEAGVHFGHLTRKWNPRMKPYIFMEKNGIHVIDLNKTMRMLDDACKVMKQMAHPRRGPGDIMEDIGSLPLSPKLV